MSRKRKTVLRVGPRRLAGAVLSVVVAVSLMQGVPAWAEAEDDPGTVAGAPTVTEAPADGSDAEASAGDPAGAGAAVPAAADAVAPAGVPRVGAGEDPGPIGSGMTTVRATPITAPGEEPAAPVEIQVPVAGDAPLPAGFGVQSLAGGLGACVVSGASLSYTTEGSQGATFWNYNEHWFQWVVALGQYTLDLDIADSAGAGDTIRIDYPGIANTPPQFLEINGVRVADVTDSGAVYEGGRVHTWIEYVLLPEIESTIERRASITATWEFYGTGEPPAVGTGVSGTVSTCAPVSGGTIQTTVSGLDVMGITVAHASTPGAALAWQVALEGDQSPVGAGGRRIMVTLSNPHEYQLRLSSLQAVAYGVSSDRTRPILGTEQEFDASSGMTVDELPNGDVVLSFVAPKLRDVQRFVVHVIGKSDLPGQSLNLRNDQVEAEFVVDGVGPVLIVPEVSYGGASGSGLPIGPPLIEKLAADGGYTVRIANPSSGAEQYQVRAGTMVDRFFVNGDLGQAYELPITNPSKGTVDGNTWSYPALKPGETITALVPFDYADWLEAGMPRITSSVNKFGQDNMNTTSCVEGEVLLATGVECSEVIRRVPPFDPGNPELRLDKALVGQPVLSEDGQSVTVRWRIQVRNDGDIIGWAPGVVVADTLPEDATDVRVAAAPVITAMGLPAEGPASVPVGTPAGTFNTSTGVWDGFDLNGGGAAAAVEITAQLPMPDGPGAEGDHTNRATVSSDDVPPVDPGAECQVNEGLDADTDGCDEVVTTLATPDLGIDKEAVNLAYAEDRRTATITWQLTVANRGPGAASNAVVTDTLPGQVDPATVAIVEQPSQGEFDVTSGVWVIGALPAGGTATVTFSGVVPVPERGQSVEVVNSASVSSPETPFVPGEECAPNETAGSDTDQCDQVTTELASPDLKVDKSQAGEPVVSADRASATITWTVTVLNAGPGQATDVVVSDTYPGEVDPATVAIVEEPTQGSFDTATGVWTVGDLDGGVSATVTFSGVVPVTASDAEIVNLVSVSSPELPYEPGADCQVNEGVDADADQCDATSTPIPGNPPAALALTGAAGTAGILGILAAALAGAGALMLARRRQRKEVITTTP